MAINKNHEFEELDGIKCAIVEKNASPARVAFLKELLGFNHYTVVVQPSPPPKAVPVPAAAETPVEITVETPSPVAETFTVGVTDVMFNATNAIFGRLLRTPGGHIVTLAYWQQKQTRADDAVPYYEKRV